MCVSIFKTKFFDLFDHFFNTPLIFPAFFEEKSEIPTPYIKSL